MQFDFLGTSEDAWSVFASLVAEAGVSVVPDLMHETPSAKALDATSESLEAAVRATSRLRFYLAGSYTRYSLEFDAVQVGDGTRYRIDPSRGGPLVEFIPPACYEQEGILCLNTGMLACPREYWNPSDAKWEGPSAELLRSYRSMVRSVKGHLIHDRQTGAWIGKEASRMLEQGQARIVAKGYRR